MRSERPWLVVINRKSGTCRPEVVVEAARKFLQGPIEVHGTEECDDLVQGIRAWLDQHDPRAVVIAGGDGSLSAAATAMKGRSLPLGIVPSGTANLLARELEIPLDPEEALRVIGRGWLRHIDGIELGERVSLCQVRFGSYSERNGAPSEELKQRFKRLAYVAKIVPWLFGDHTTCFDVRVDGRQVSTRAAFVLVTNLGTLIGNLEWGKEIRPDDRAVDVLVVKASGAADYAKLLWSAVKEKQDERDELVQYRARESVEVIPHDEVDVMIDGELVDAKACRLRILPAYVPIFVPGPLAPG